MKTATNVTFSLIERARDMVRFLSLVTLALIVGHQASHGQARLLSGDPQQIASNTYGYIARNSIADLDGRRCAEPLREGILKILRSKSIDVLVAQNTSLHQKNCLDRFSRLVVFKKFEPQSSTGSQHALARRTVVSFDLNRHTRYVHIDWFSETTANEFAINTYGNIPPNMILDLRNNGGGSLRAAETIVHMFAPSGNMTLAAYVRRSHTEVLTSTAPGRLRDVRVIVLVNRDTASASEFLAGVLRQTNRSTRLIGERTYGKGVFQDVLDLGSDFGLYITAGEYFIGADRVTGKVHGRGLTPDLTLSDPYPREVDKDPAVKLAERLLR